VSAVAVDDGYDFHVVVLDGTWVVRAPRRPACAEALAVEAALQAFDVGELPVPRPDWLESFQTLCDPARPRRPADRRDRLGRNRLAPWFGARHEVFHGRTPSLDAMRSTL
jgi:hypothetical protein